MFLVIFGCSTLLNTSMEIARVLEVDVKDLLVSTTNDSVYIKIPKV